MGWFGEGQERMASAAGAPRRLIFMAAGAGLMLVAGTLSLRYALGVRGKAEQAMAAAAGAAELGAARDPFGRAEEPPRPQGGFGDGMAPATVDLSKHETLTPRDARVEGGERVAPFHGFGVEVDSVPAGARVLVNGEDLGETPLTASVRCTAGAEVAVRVVRPGWRTWEKRTRCRDDALVAFEARLAR